MTETTTTNSFDAALNTMRDIMETERTRLATIGIEATEKQLLNHLETTLETYEDENIKPAPKDWKFL